MNELIADETTRGIELAVTPVVFGVLGWLLDRWLGTGPWLAAGLAAFALVGTIAKMWFSYDSQMRALESSGRWARRTQTAPPAAIDEVDLWADRRASSA